MLFMGIASLIGGALALLLPETLGEPLVEFIDDVDELGKNGKPFFSWWSKAKVDEHLEEQLERQKTKHREN